MVQWLGLPFVLFVPGALAYRLPVAERSRRAGWPVEERVFWALLISILWSTLAGLALAAAGRYSYPALVLVNAVVSAVLLLIWRGRLRYDASPARPTWSALGPLAALALGAWLYAPPSEYVLGGKDPGIYMNQGIQIGQRRALTVPDGTLAALPAEHRDLFLLGGTADGLNEGLRFMGFFVADRERGEVVGQFPQGFPIWIAAGYGVNGLTGARYATPAWALVGLFAVYCLWARLIGPLAAAAAAALLAVNVAEVWFARYPSSELMQQALLAAGLLALARACRDGDRFFDAVAGAALGLMVFARFDSVLVLAAVGGGLVVLAADGTRPRAAFLLPLAGLLALAVPYYAGPLRSYIWIPLIQLGGARTLAVLPVLLAAAAALALAAHRRLPEVTRLARTWLPRAAALAIVAVAAYAYFWREPAGKLAAHDAYAMRTFAWYVTGPGLALAVIGLSGLWLLRFWRDPVTITSLTAISVFFLYKVRIVPDHFWQSRRYLAVLLPLTCAAAAAAGCALLAWARSRTAQRGRALRVSAAAAGAMVAVVSLGGLGTAFLTASKPVAEHVEYAGVIPALERVAARFTDRDLVVVESRGSSDAHVLATPLAYIYARHVLLLNSPRPDPAGFARFLAWACGRYEHVYFLADGGTALALPDVDVQAVATDHIDTPEYESLRDAYPAQARTKKFRLSVFELRPAAAGSSRAVTDIDIGGPDDVWVLRIFAKEEQKGVWYRWTRNVSYVNLLGVSAESRTVTLWLSNGGRPAAAGAATMRVLFNEVPLGTATVTEGFAPYTFPIPAELAAAAAARTTASVLRLESSVWNPRKVLGVPDDRELGVMLDRVKVH